MTAPPAGAEEPPPLLLVTAQGLMKRLAIEELVGPEIDLGDLDSVEETITVLTDKGLLG